MPLLALLALHLDARASCERAATPGELDLVLAQAEDAYAALQAERFDAAVTVGAQDLACLREPIPAPLAARYHRVQGLFAFSRRDDDAARRAFAAARTLEAAWQFPVTLVPSGNRVWDLYLAIDPETLRHQPIPPPAEGDVWFDGQRGLDRPADVPTVMQLLGGSSTWSGDLAPGDPLPAYVPAPVPANAVASSRPRRRRAGASVAVLSAGLATAGTIVVLGVRQAGALYADDPTVDYEAYHDETLMPRDRLGVGLVAAGSAGLVLGGVLALAPQS